MSQCDCGAEAVMVRGNREQIDRCSRCWRESWLEDTLSSMSVHKVFHQARIDDFNKSIKQYNRTQSFFINGQAGVGKTHLAIAMLVEDILETPSNSRLNVDFVSMLNLLAKIKSTYGNKNSLLSEDYLLDYYSNLKDLYIDDIGIEQSSDWALARVYQIIDYRWGNNLRTIITSNHDLNSLSEKLDARISSRIEGMCNVIQLTGKDRRRR